MGEEFRLCGECGKELTKETMWSEYTCKECAEKLGLTGPKYKNFHFVSDNAVVVITTDGEDEATAILRETVRMPQDFRLEQVTGIEG